MSNARTWAAKTISDRNPVIIASSWQLKFTVAEATVGDVVGTNDAGPWGVASCDYADVGKLLITLNDRYDKLLFAHANVSNNGFTGDDVNGKRAIGTSFRAATVNYDGENSVEFNLYTQKSGAVAHNAQMYLADPTIYFVHFYLVLSNSAEEVTGVTNSFFPA